MRQAWIILAFALAGCGPRPEALICRPVDFNPNAAERTSPYEKGGLTAITAEGECYKYFTYILTTEETSDRGIRDGVISRCVLWAAPASAARIASYLNGRDAMTLSTAELAAMRSWDAEMGAAEQGKIPHYIVEARAGHCKP